MTYLDETLAAARELARASRWSRALSLLDAAVDATSRAAVDATTGIALDATTGIALDAAAGATVGAATDTATRATTGTATAAAAGDPARIALAAAEVALESDWFAETALAADRLAAADRLCAPSWDLDFLHLRHDYRAQLHTSGTAEFGPAGKDPAALERLRGQAGSLADRAPDRLRHGWARMYLGLILDNLFADPEAAPLHYAAALEAGDALPTPEARERVQARETDQIRKTDQACETGDTRATDQTRETSDTRATGATGDDLLAREALRHLGDHDRDRGDLATARARWERATFLGARAGLVAGTLSQQLLLATLPGAQDTHRLATEIARWSCAIGAPGLRSQAEALAPAPQSVRAITTSSSSNSPVGSNPSAR
jgi:hypothetical protein